MNALAGLEGLQGMPLLLGLALATWVSEDLACIGAGLLVATGDVAFAAATLACLLGILSGDVLLVAAGRTWGRPVLDRWPLARWLTAGDLARAERWFVQRGGRLILASRFLPGTRLATYLAAGVLRAPWLPVIGWFVLSCAVWTPLLVGLAAVVGERSLELLSVWQDAVPVLLGAGILVVLGVRAALAMGTWKGRRLLWSRWVRLTRWEYWPSWALYPPVIVYLGLLACRYRSFRVVTAVNPGIGAGGGLVGESKRAILRGLEGLRPLAPAECPRVARWRYLPPDVSDARANEVSAFVAEGGGAYPVVLKPDVGERGEGVTIVRHPDEVSAALARLPGPLILQEFVPGVEFGVFYLRHPSWDHGRIFAVTEKRLPEVVGDGQKSLETLILADERAVGQARLFLNRFVDRLDQVPAMNDRIPLAELGTHCRGALFLDGGHLVTPALAEAVETCSRRFDGFYFGRYDVRSESVAAFQSGRFQIIELNGLTSEATSIYDPRHGLVHAWSVLCRQWAWAWAIGAENHRRGAKILTWGELWGLVRKRRMDEEVADRPAEESQLQSQGGRR